MQFDYVMHGIVPGIKFNTCRTSHELNVKFYRYVVVRFFHSISFKTQILDESQ